MSAPRATRAQLEPVVERVLARGNGRTAELVLVRADPGSAAGIGAVGDPPLAVIGSRSPLQIRAALRERGDHPLVVLTDLDLHALGDDLIARAAGRRVHPLDRWVTVCQLFGAVRPSHELATRAHLADALIEARPLAGYPQVTSRVLDLDTATAALVRAWLGIADHVHDLAGFVTWASRTEGAGRISAGGALLDELRPTLVDRFGRGVDAVIAAVRAGHVDDLVPLGLVAGLVHGAGPEAAVPAARLDERLGTTRLDPATHVAWGDGAASLVDAVDDPARAARWLERAETLLADLDATPLAHRSDLLRSGFEQRIHQAGTALSRWHGDPDDASLAGAAEAAIARVERHRTARRIPERSHRLRMAARLVRRRSLDITGAADLAGFAAAYQRDGAWLDAARVVVSRGDPDPVLDSLCRALTADADRAREHQGATLAKVLAAAAQPLPGRKAGVVGVEDVLADVVAPVAAERPVLVLVLDGLGLPTFCDIVDAVEAAGWAQYRPADLAEPPVGVAVLPTVTEVSRTSLLCGTRRRGDDGSESRGFAGHDALRGVSKPDAPPLLFHKRDLRVGGLDTLPANLLDDIADPHRRVVGVVLNNIDERLKDVTQPVAGWGMDELAPLRDLLREARRAGRAVVLSADHGHVLDRDAQARRAGGGGERWRPADPPSGDGEIEVSGPRVVADGGRAVMLWREQLHYGTRRNGYHGGLTPQELFVPVAVLAVDDLDGWAPTTTRRPAWWHHTPIVTGPPTVPVTAAPGPARPARPQPAEPTLFDEIPPARAPARAGPGGPPAAPGTVPTSPAAGAAVSPWVERILATPQLAERRRSPRIRLGDDELRRLLTVLEATGTAPVVHARLAQEAGLPPSRIGRYVAQLQTLLNVDGYAVVTVRGDEVRFDRGLLERQLEL
jgi:hypothetical protein